MWRTWQNPPELHSILFFSSTIYRRIFEHHSLTTPKQIWNNLFECQLVNTVETTFVEIAIFYIQLFQICLDFHAIQIFIFRCFLNSFNFDMKMANSDKCGNFFRYQKAFNTFVSIFTVVFIKWRWRVFTQ